jgi:hypothetical protein
VVYLHVNRELDFWCSSGIIVFPTHGPCKAGGSGTDNPQTRVRRLVSDKGLWNLKMAMKSVVILFFSHFSRLNKVQI